MKDTFTSRETIGLMAAAIRNAGMPPIPPDTPANVKALVQAIIIAHSIVIMRAVGDQLGFEVQSQMVTPEEMAKIRAEHPEADIEMTLGPTDSGLDMAVVDGPKPEPVEDDFAAFMQRIGYTSPDIIN